MTEIETETKTSLKKTKIWAKLETETNIMTDTDTRNVWLLLEERERGESRKKRNVFAFIANFSLKNFFTNLSIIFCTMKAIYYESVNVIIWLIQSKIIYFPKTFRIYYSKFCKKAF
jgi:hypothetical protein